MDDAWKLVVGRFKHKIGLVTGNSTIDYRMTGRSSQKRMSLSQQRLILHQRGRSPTMDFPVGHDPWRG